MTTVNGVEMTMTPQLANHNMPVAIYMVKRVLAPDAANLDLITVLRMNPNFSLVVRCIQIAGLLETFQELGPFTAFMPNDEAFKLSFAGTDALEKFMADPARMKAALLRHIVKGTYFLVGLASGDLPTLAEPLSLKIVVKDQQSEIIIYIALFVSFY